MRISKLFRLSRRFGLERKLFPTISVLGDGNKAARRDASGSIPPLGNTLVGAPEPLMGIPQKPFGLRFDTCVRRVSKISPTKVGFALQSSAVGFGMDAPVLGSTCGATVLVRKSLKSPPIMVGVGIRLKCGIPWRTRSPS